MSSIKVEKIRFMRWLQAIIITSFAVFFIFGFLRQLRFDFLRQGLLQRLFRFSPKVTQIPTQPSPTPPIFPGTRENPFGVMFANPEKAKLAKDLGVLYYRPASIFVNKWPYSCLECENAINSGLKLVLTVRNNGAPQQPTTPPTDLVTYKRVIGEIIDKYKPVLLVVENEENSEALFYSGSPEQYHDQLRAACDAAHQRGIKCTNGGFVSSLVVLLVANSYYEQGDAAKANEYLNRTLGSRLTELAGSTDITKIVNIPKAKKQLERGKALISGYKNNGADFINFHWYIRDAAAIEEAVNYLKSLTGFEAMTNEIGQQKSEDPAWVTAVMGKVVELRLPYAIWFSVDISGYGGARSLIDANGNLRPNGQAFKEYIENSF